MPAKTFHETNPPTMEAWSRMSDARDFYVVLHDIVGTAFTTRIYQIDDHGTKVNRHETQAGDAIVKGSIVSAKSFGPGVDLQRLVDLGAIREASPWEQEEVLRNFAAADAAKARARGPAERDEAGKDAPPVNEPKAVNDAKVDEARAKADAAKK